MKLSASFHDKAIDPHQYDDMLLLPHPSIPGHPPMPRSSRAAQFAPFAALTGHSDAIRETARLTDTRPTLDESMKAALDDRLQQLQACAALHPTARITYFVPDPVKEGGAYHTVTGAVKKLDTYAGLLILLDGSRIPIADIFAVESSCLAADTTE